MANDQLERKLNESINCVFPEGVTDAQRESISNIFFAGAAAYYIIMVESMDNTTDEPTEEELATVQSLHDELIEYRIRMLCVQ